MNRTGVFSKIKSVIVIVIALVIFPTAVLASANGEAEYVQYVATGGNTSNKDYENEVMNVILPTTDIFNTPFMVDPQGVLSLTEEGGTVNPKAAGAVVPNVIASVKNSSDFPVNVIMDIYITKNLETGEASSVKLVDSSTGLEASKNNELYLNVYATDHITDENLIKLKSYNADYELINRKEFVNVINILANGKQEAMEISFLLKGNDSGLYENGGISDDYSQVAFCVGGNVSQAANWNKYIGDTGEKIAMRAVFSLEKSSKDIEDKVEITAFQSREPEYLNNISIYGMATASNATASNAADSALTTEYIISESENDLIFPIDFGRGGKRVTVADVYIIQGNDAKVSLTEGIDYDVTSLGINLKDSSETLWCLDEAASGILSFRCINIEGKEKYLNVAFKTVEK